MSRVIYTDQEHILDQGQPLWPPRENPTEREQKLWEALAALTDRQQTILEMRHYGEHTFKQIGQHLGISKQAAHSTYTKATQHLKEALNETIQ